ncbi:unnamed protein product [Mesocestoides corti]|uniref:F-box domain-containing protein n=1 Tax=Mesocestoides corti TaxID=53468 RepID=A0A0R3U143_MESCO|nr:unnamed protein product [Mesocestoides corti]
MSDSTGPSSDKSSASLEPPLTEPRSDLQSLEPSTQSILNSTESGVLQPCLISTLPNELIIRIFKYLPLFQVTTSVSRVCRLWRQLALSPALNDAMYLNSQVPADVCANLLKDRPFLLILRITGLRCLPYVIPYICQLDRLQCLNMGFCDLSDAAAQSLSKNLPGDLRHLNVEGCNFVKMFFIRDLITQCRNLEALNLSHCLEVNNECIITLARAGLRRLQRLNLDGIQWITDEALRDGLAAMASQLTALWLDGFEVTTHGLCAFLSHVPAWTQLQVLSISFSDNLSDYSLRPITKIANLRELRLRKGRNLTTSALISLFSDSEQRLSRLRSIDLSDCPGVTDAVVDAICECCGPNLVELLLNWCWGVSDVGLARIIGCCNKLRHLSLVGNHTLFGEPFINLCERQPMLQFLNLTQCNQIVDSVITTVAKQMPSLYIFDYFGERVGGVDDVCQYDLLRTINKAPICEH